MPTKKTANQNKRTTVKTSKIKNDGVAVPDKTRTQPLKQAAPKQEQDFYVVGIGASAGGLAAFEAFFNKLPLNHNIAVIVVSHLDPKHVSILPELIQKATEMQVFQIEDGMTVEPDCVYVIPPNKNISIFNKRLQLENISNGRGSRMSVDTFFRSLAEDQKEKAVGIILSGMGMDGSLGLKAIKAELGLVMVQDPDSAQSNSMPNSAIETNLVDYILPPDEMPAALIQYTQSSFRKIVHSSPIMEKNVPPSLLKIYHLLRSHTGHDFSLYKQNTIFRRIERRMNVHHLDEMPQYVQYLQQTPHEIQALFKELLIGVTSFFRDDEAFQLLKQRLLLLLNDKADDYCVRVWVSGCSSGEEAYSIAIILRECMIQLNKHFNIQVFATDIDDDAINVARTGFYPLSIVSDVEADILKRYFIKEEVGYRIKKDIREMVIFAIQNIIKDPPFTKLDLVSCRNMLIYLNAELQKKLMPIFHYSLKEGGLLFLGSSESIGGFTEAFIPIDRKWKIYHRKAGLFPSTENQIGFPLKIPSYERTTFRDPQTSIKSFPQLIERILLDEYVLPSIIVNKNGVIHYVHNDTARYLALPSGETKANNVFEMAREGLKVELASAIRKATTQNKKIIYEGLSVASGNGSGPGVHFFNLIVKPLTIPEPLQELLLVSFQKMISPVEIVKKQSKSRSGSKTSKAAEVLEQELQHTKETLQTTIEELETSNEELKSSNEELQSTNEELQSANEELETSKEEQNSLNEELVTVNTELQSKIDEFSKTAGDMKNLLDGTEIPTIFLNNDLNINRFTQHATKVIHLIPSDMGRPLSHLVSNLKYDNLVKDARAVLDSLIPKKAEVQTKDGQWYLLRISPYRTLENVIDGVVITFNEISKQKRLNERLQLEIDQRIESEERDALISQLLGNGIYQIDDSGIIIYANEIYASMFGYTLTELVGMHFLEMVSPQAKKETKKYHSKLPKGKVVKGESVGLHKSGRQFKTIFQVVPMFKAGVAIGVIGTIQIAEGLM